MVTITIVDYGMGNIQSVRNAFAHLGHDVAESGGPDEIAAADKLVLPGVGSFREAAKRLEGGLRDALKEAVETRGRPILGICLGMQLLAEHGTEHGETEGLGWIAGSVVEIPRTDASLRLPHVGWNALAVVVPSCPLMAGVDDGADCYFVHSYYLKADNPEDVVANTDYGSRITAAVARNNVFGTQFHPEKSQPAGLAILDNFARL